MSNRDFERCPECHNLLGQLDDKCEACRRCGISYDDMEEKEDKEIFK